MSLFPTMVGVATPSETFWVHVQVAVEPAGPVALGKAVQTVCFPLKVRGPLRLGNANHDVLSDDPLPVPPGQYDVLATFLQPRVARSWRSFPVRLSFRPAGSLGALRTLKLEET